MIYFHSTIVRSRIEEWSQVCLQEEVHAGKWGTMQEEFRNQGIEYRSLVIAKNDDGEVIGAASQLRQPAWGGLHAQQHYGRDEYNIGVFVKPEYRRQGIGKKLVQKLKTRTKATLVGSPHNDATNKFFQESRA
jgi:GNAT superfamily N-acetyltransferase